MNECVGTILALMVLAFAVIGVASLSGIDFSGKDMATECSLTKLEIIEKCVGIGSKNEGVIYYNLLYDTDNHDYFDVDRNRAEEVLSNCEYVGFNIYKCVQRDGSMSNYTSYQLRAYIKKGYIPIYD
jgi:hypothetical protein